jgi:hypothetical protein
VPEEEQHVEQKFLQMAKVDGVEKEVEVEELPVEEQHAEQQYLQMAKKEQEAEEMEKEEEVED